MDIRSRRANRKRSVGVESGAGPSRKRITYVDLTVETPHEDPSKVEHFAETSHEDPSKVEHFGCLPSDISRDDAREYALDHIQTLVERERTNTRVYKNRSPPSA